MLCPGGGCHHACQSHERQRDSLSNTAIIRHMVRSDATCRAFAAHCVVSSPLRITVCASCYAVMELCHYFESTTYHKQPFLIHMGTRRMRADGNQCSSAEPGTWSQAAVARVMAPQATSTTPVPRLTRLPQRRLFSASTSSARPAIQARFMIPPTNSSAISIQQRLPCG